MRNSSALRVAVFVIAAVANAHLAAAQGMTEQRGSIVIYPKVWADAHRDTMIELSNRGNPPARARCFYVNAAPTSINLPAGPSNPRRWDVTAFIVNLTAQQPTYWTVSAGRAANPSDGIPGYDPGAIPAMSNFQGELLCVQIAEDDSPFNGNTLLGTAMVRDADSTDTARYNAIALRGLDINDGNRILCLGSPADPRCNPSLPEYEPCPDEMGFNHAADLAPDEFAGSGSITTELTVLSCTQTLISGSSRTFPMRYWITDPFELTTDAAHVVTNVWDNKLLRDVSFIFRADTLGSSYARTRMYSEETGNVLGVAQELRGSSAVSPSAGSAFTNLSALKPGTKGDVIVLPE